MQEVVKSVAQFGIAPIMEIPGAVKNVVRLYCRQLLAIKKLSAGTGTAAAWKSTMLHISGDICLTHQLLLSVDIYVHGFFAMKKTGSYLGCGFR